MPSVPIGAFLHVQPWFYPASQTMGVSWKRDHEKQRRESI